jgi:phosphate transport system protein
MTGGIHRHFHEELTQVRERLLTMSGAAESALEGALEALVRRDAARAAAVIRGDDDIDRREVGIEERCVELIALHQPMARDLRLLLSLLRIANALERIGDHAVNIAQAAGRIAALPAERPAAELDRMATLVRAMLADAIDAFTRHDGAGARAVCRRDDAVDALNRSIRATLMSRMMQEPASVPLAMDLVLVSRNLERVADLATNIAEGVVYLAEGRSIKHAPGGDAQ